MRTCTLCLVLVGASAVPNLLFTSHDSTHSCTVALTAKDRLISDCDVGTGTTSLNSLQSAVDTLSSFSATQADGISNNIEALRSFAEGQAKENAALRNLVTALSSTVENLSRQVSELAISHDNEVAKLNTKLDGDISDLAELDQAYQKADDELAAAIGAVSKMKGPKGDTGPAGPPGIDATNFPTPIPITPNPTPFPTPQPTAFPTQYPTPVPPTPSPTPSEHLCAWEGGHCGGCHGKVWYGSGNSVAQIKSHGRYATRNSNGGIGCHNGVFGDPWGGKRKNCICEGN